ncbi:MAG: ABC transporter permease [Labrys sp. (in: a-proteobacteria)]|jgi:simple sugar transport system permease protein
MHDMLKKLRSKNEFWLAIVLIVVIAFFSITAPGFFTIGNLYDLLTQNAFTGILCAGLIVVLIAGGIDISFTATASVVQYATITIANAYGANWVTLLLMAGFLGMLLGFINAIFIVRFKMHSIIVSIATLNIFYGLLIFITSGDYITTVPDFFYEGINWFEFEVGRRSYAMNLQMVLLFGSFLLTAVLLKATSIGRQIYAMGGNPDAAQRLGFSIFRLNLFVYGYMGFIAGIASIAHAQLQLNVTPTVLVGRELTVLAAVVLGGASLMGGVGTVLGTILGLTLLCILQNGLVILGLPARWEGAVSGLVILIAVSASALEASRQQTMQRAARKTGQTGATA